MMRSFTHLGVTFFSFVPWNRVAVNDSDEGHQGYRGYESYQDEPRERAGRDLPELFMNGYTGIRRSRNYGTTHGVARSSHTGGF